MINTVNVIGPTLVLNKDFLSFIVELCRENIGKIPDWLSLFKKQARIVSDTAVVTLVIRSAFIRESTNQM